VRRAKDLRAGKHDAPRVQTPSAPVNGHAAAATPAPVSTTPAPQAPVAPPALRPVEQVVKQQKRRYLRQAVQGAELMISEPGVFLGKTSSRVVVKKQRRVIMEMPLRQLVWHYHEGWLTSTIHFNFTDYQSIL